MTIMHRASIRCNAAGILLCCLLFYCFTLASPRIAAAQTTTVTIHTEPEANVHLGKVFLGRTPATAILKNNNTVVIEISEDGYVTTSRTIDVGPNIDPNLFVQLKPAVGTAQIVDLPRGARVWLNEAELHNPGSTFPLEGPDTQLDIKLPNQRMIRQVLDAVDTQHLNLALVSSTNDTGALWRSALIPGWGQYHDRRTTGKSLIFASLAAIAGGGAIWSQIQYAKADDVYSEATFWYEAARDEQSAFARRQELLAAFDDVEKYDLFRRRLTQAVVAVYFVNLMDVFAQHLRMPALGVVSSSSISATPYIAPGKQGPAIGLTLTF